MTPGFGQAARRLVAGQPDDSSRQVADHAAQACARFTSHLGKLLGHAGAQVLLRRSLSIASSEVTWLAASLISGDPLFALRSTMELQDPDAIRDAFVAILWAFVSLLERLIGVALVARQLEDVWPSIFTYPAKDTP